MAGGSLTPNSCHSCWIDQTCTSSGKVSRPVDPLRTELDLSAFALDWSSFLFHFWLKSPYFDLSASTQNRSWLKFYYKMTPNLVWINKSWINKLLITSSWPLASERMCHHSSGSCRLLLMFTLAQKSGKNGLHKNGSSTQSPNRKRLKPSVAKSKKADKPLFEVLSTEVSDAKVINEGAAARC